jgi:hypothetical protein
MHWQPNTLLIIHRIFAEPRLVEVVPHVSEGASRAADRMGGVGRSNS